MPTDLASELRAFDFAAYERAVRQRGRAELASDTALIREFAFLVKAAKDAVVNRSGSMDEPTAEIAARFARAQYRILTDADHLYDHYASISVLRRLLKVDDDISLDRKQAQIWSVFQQLIAAQLEFETAALAGGLPYATREFSPRVSRERLARLAELQQAVPARHQVTVPPVPASAPAEADLRALIERGEPTVIGRLLVFPQTTCHDEVAFIRLIQLAECLFWGALTHVMTALACIGREDIEAGTTALSSAADFAAPLVTVFHAVRTMPPEHFLSFRPTTNHASAIQSVSWQLLDAHVYGVLPEKADVLAAIPNLRREIGRLARPEFTPLVVAVSAHRDGQSGSVLHAAAVRLDHGLRAWRKFHEKQLAGRTNPSYLPAGALGTGGTSGYQYLAVQNPPRIVQQLPEGPAGDSAAPELAGLAAGLVP